ncbi:hypothetical protein WEH80_28670 [Actinomycetes bacterium KLBMP 9759]
MSTDLATVLRRVEALQPGVVAVGHGRDPLSVAQAEAFAGAWPGEIGDVVSWPARAASWLRPATRLAAAGDVWVVADATGGWRGMLPRLAGTSWRSDRTVVFLP